jgi:DNA-binding transcriptional LysR family regulator
MDLKQLRYFVAIIQCESVTRASTQLNVPQPGVSRSAQMRVTT